jgi:two-component system, NarL family, response regulator DevR
MIEPEPNIKQAIRVFCVEDDADTVEMYREVCRDAADLDFVASLPSTHALPLALDTTHPDVVVMDLGLPGGSSTLDVISRLRISHPDLVIVVATGYKDPQIQQEVLARGADAFVVKNGDLKHWLETIRASVARRRAAGSGAS